MQQASQRLFALVTVVFVALAAFLAARIVSQTIAYRIHTDEGAVPPAPAPVRRVEEPSRGADLRAIQDRNLFNTKPAPPAPAVPDTPPPAAPVTAPEPPAALPITLVATGVRTRGPSFAVVEAGGETRLYRIGEQVQPGAVLEEVRTDRVFITQGTSRQEYLLFANRQGAAPSGKPQRPAFPGRPGVRPAREGAPTPSAEGDTIRQVSENAWVVDRREVEQATANLSQLITQIRVVPNMGPDNQADGFKVFSIRPASLFARIGLRNGDVLKEVNGIPLTGVDQAYQALTGLQGETSIQVNLIRQNEPITLSYEIR